MARTAPAPTPAENASPPSGNGVSVDFERECVEFFADVVGVLGVPRSVGQIYGLLFSSPEPLSFTDIAARLDISKGSASQGLQALKQLGAVHLAEARDAHQRPEGGDLRPEGGRSREAEGGRSGRPLGGDGHKPESGKLTAESEPTQLLSSVRGGSRRELYVPELGLRKLVSGVLREKVEPIVRDGGARVKTLRACAEAAPDEAARKFSTTRVKQIETWRRQMRLLLPLMKTILGPARA